MKNLVMGAAKGYGWQELEPFVASCKKNCPAADLVLFVDDISDFTRDKLIRTGVTVIDIPATFKGALIIHTRWKMYADYLEAHGNYAQVFICDTRDVIFQGDLFKPFKGCTNWLGYATELPKIGEDMEYNYPWFVDAFGEAEADKIADKKIICVGTIIGSATEIKIFCLVMWDTLKDNDVWGHEQAVVNYFVWNNLLPIENLLEIDVQSGAIFTNGLIKNNKIFGEEILRGDGGVPAVVHQYNRHSELIELVDKIYRDKNFQADEKFFDTRSVLEQTMCLLYADKIVEATQIFLKKLLADPNFSDYLQALIKLWNLVLKKPPSKTSELLDAAIQDALTSVTCFPNEISKILETIALAEKSGRPINFKFKSNIANALLLMANDAVDSNQAELCFKCLEQIDKLNMPPDKNFYLFVAKANRIFGRKDNALAAYKEALKFD